MFINDVLDFDENELLDDFENDYSFFDDISYSHVETVYFDCQRYLYFCPYCGCNLNPKLFYDCVHVVCPACTAGFRYDSHDEFIKLVKDTTGQELFFSEQLPF